MLIPTLDSFSYKVVFVGDSGVGKTSLIQRINTSKFEGNFDSTIGASAIQKEVETSIGVIKLNIWDTAGKEKYKSLISTYARNACAAILCFDLSSNESFLSLDEWINELQNICDINCCFFVVGNKSDLDQHVPISTVNKWCEERKYKFFITSAKTGIGIPEFIKEVAEDVIVAKEQTSEKNSPIPQPEESKSTCC